jgi:hypothetical protein
MTARAGARRAVCLMIASALAAGCGPSDQPASDAPAAAVAREPAPPPRHVLLVSIDTLRADHLGCYGYPKPTSPQLDALAAESIVFDNAWATAPMPRCSPACTRAITGRASSATASTRRWERWRRRCAPVASPPAPS